MRNRLVERLEAGEAIEPRYRLDVTLDDYRRLEEIGVTDAGTMPINAGGRIVMDQSTRQRLLGQRVDAARDVESIYDTSPPTTKIDAINRFAEEIMSHWTDR